MEWCIVWFWLHTEQEEITDTCFSDRTQCEWVAGYQNEREWGGIARLDEVRRVSRCDPFNSG